MGDISAVQIKPAFRDAAKKKDLSRNVMVFGLQEEEEEEDI